MVKHFKDFIDLNKRIGKIFITSLIEGTGKTLLSCAIQVNKMLRGRSDYWKSSEAVKEYNSLGYNFSMEYDHLCASNYNCNCSGTSQPSLTTYRVNPFRLGLWCEDYDTDFYAPCTCFFITEAQRPFNAYMWQYVRPEIRAFWETSRQAKYDLVIDTNKPNQVVSDIRNLCNRIIHLWKECEEIKDLKGEVVGHRLFVREFSSYDDFDKSRKSLKDVKFEEYELVLDRCYYKNYDSYMCRILHLKGRAEQDFLFEKFPEIKSIEDVENFGDMFGLYVPKGYYKKNTDYAKEEKIPSSKFEEKNPFGSFSFD